jgi:hypothetical protein
MGEIADAMLSGEMCEMCGEYICSECAEMGIPMYCSKSCARDRGVHDKSRICTHEIE